jgi:predicted dehydrogenase
MPIRFGALGAAMITPRALVYPCMDERRAAITAIAAREPARARAFADHHQIPVVLERYADVIEHPKVDAVYVPLHIPVHCEWTIRALRAGKHVLCEKSFASNAAEAQEMAAVGRESGRVLMDAFHYRYHPVFHRAREIYQSGELGAIRHIDAAFHIPITDPASIRMNYALGGGVTMDIGCYPISWVRHITGEEPEMVEAQAEVGPEHVDVSLKARMTLPSGVTATTSGDMRPGTAFTAYFSVTGSAGSMRVINPLVPQMGHEIQVKVGASQRVERLDRRATYGYQLDAFLDAIEHGTPLLTGAADAVRQMQVIDRCYHAAGLPLRGLPLPA